MNPTEAIVEREVRVDARPETIFPFFTDPELMVRWMGNSAQADPRPGGVYRIDINGTYIARGEYVEVSPPDRVVFTWGWEGEGSIEPGASTVEVTLTPDGEETLVRLVHRDLPSEDSASAHGRGWEHYLKRLRVAGAGGDPGPDQGVVQTSAQAD
jgi:uncharacterized protein YndB with AHSA1/START domain